MTVETNGGTDTWGTPFDGGGTPLETDDAGGSGTNFRIEREVRAGTHHVEVRGFHPSTTGPYTLSVRADGNGAEARPLRRRGIMQPGDRSGDPSPLGGPPTRRRKRHLTVNYNPAQGI